MATNAPRQTAFSAGDLVGERYQIVRLIGRGGMGAVYEAEDRELRERVALKLLLPSLARDPRSMAWLKREISLARRVTHPNVCRLFELGFHCLQPAAEELARTPFLTMEMLRGETLTEHLRRSGRMGSVEAVPLVRQMAAALAAAHQAGVVHGDFKSGNVMLVPEAEARLASALGAAAGGADEPAARSSPATIRVVVTDFGLARGVLAGAGRGVASTPRPDLPGETGDDAAFSLGSIDGSALVGSPAYMAPEQVEGRRPSTAADLYALGVVVYEMVTGTLPFVGDTPLHTAVKRLVEPPPPVRPLALDVDPRLEAVVLRCLARDPAQRYGSAAELLETLAEREPAAPSAATPTTGPVTVPAAAAVAAAAAAPAVAPGDKRRGRATRRRMAAAVAAGLCVILALGWLAKRLLPARGGSSTAQSGEQEGRGPQRPAALPGDVAQRHGPRSEKAGGQAPTSQAASVRMADGREPRRSIAILGFHNLTGDSTAAWLSTALAEMLTSELAAGGELRAVAGEQTARAVRDLGVREGEGVAAHTVSRIAARLHVDLIVVGSYAALGEKGGGQVRLDVSILDAATGRTLVRADETGDQVGLFELVERLGARLRGRLGVAAVPVAEVAAVRAALPVKGEVLRLYVEGLASLRLGEAQQASERLQQAVAADPKIRRLRARGTAGPWRD